jgi:hypothetical protein
LPSSSQYAAAHVASNTIDGVNAFGDTATVRSWWSSPLPLSLGTRNMLAKFTDTIRRADFCTASVWITVEKKLFTLFLLNFFLLRGAPRHDLKNNCSVRFWHPNWWPPQI